MPYETEVKAIAYVIDAECWVSYSGKPKAHKQAMDARRTSSLEEAQAIWDNRQQAILNAQQPEVQSARLDEACEALVNWFGYAWEGIRDAGTETIESKGHQPWCFDGAGNKKFQGYRQDVRDIVLKMTDMLR